MRLYTALPTNEPSAPNMYIRGFGHVPPHRFTLTMGTPSSTEEWMRATPIGDSSDRSTVLAAPRRYELSLVQNHVLCGPLPAAGSEHSKAYSLLPLATYSPHLSASSDLRRVVTLSTFDIWMKREKTGFSRFSSACVVLDRCLHINYRLGRQALCATFTSQVTISPALECAACQRHTCVLLTKRHMRNGTLRQRQL